jgi:predicted aminopeptidase
VTGTGEVPRKVGPESARTHRIPRPLLLGVVLLPMALLLFSCSGCSPVYVARAGWAEMKILRGRRPLEEVIGDPRTDEDTRHKLLLARQARAFAIHQLGLDAGDSYTSFTQLETDTLAWVLSAAYKDRLESKTWWFPIVGRVPYKGYSSQEGAEKAQAKLERDGFDTYLRTTSAFSTLGWFADPLLSSLLRYDDVDLVETILHELSHNHLFVPGQVQFNESFATFVGRVGAIRFFCGPDRVPQNSPECQAANDRWDEYQDFSRFLGEFIGELEALYATADFTVERKVQARVDLLNDYRDRYRNDDATEATPLVRGFLDRPLNNAVLLARMRYFHRLPDFQTFLGEHGGDLRAAVAALADGVKTAGDPFDLLPPRG